MMFEIIKIKSLTKNSNIKGKRKRKCIENFLNMVMIKAAKGFKSKKELAQRIELYKPVMFNK